MNVVGSSTGILLRSAIVLLWFGAASGLARTIPPSVLPGLGPTAAREAVDADQPPWRGVVRVQTEVGSRCTGALIGPRLVVTAAHCLFGRGTGRLVRPSSIHVLTGYSHGVFAGHARAVAVEIGARFEPGSDGQRLASSPADSDWALLTLEMPLGTTDRVLPMISALPAPDTPAMLGGFEQDRAQVIVADVACRVIGPVQDGGAIMLQHSCAGTRGVSGAPLLVQLADGGWGVAGIASVAFLGQPGGLAVPIAGIVARSAAERQRNPG